ncbi:hypothetical protein A0H81_12652 [Grifola frondosa]|uniref:Uncharacterized protein n=1 Tax=Grifola frondosa TaxID=5627 RepID=A0A1C7LTU5_GRIFR|nr:hypothetical protein A0H81_12652 [Grifola frondosa]
MSLVHNKWKIAQQRSTRDHAPGILSNLPSPNLYVPANSLVLYPVRPHSSEQAIPMSDYAPLSQEEDYDKASSPSSESIESAPAPAATWHALNKTLIWGAVVMVLLAVNMFCLAITTRQVRVVFQTLQTHLDFVETRALPRPDPLDGMEQLLR